MVKIINIISNQVRFPLNIVKGSEKQRFRKAQSLTQNVFDYIKSFGDCNRDTQLLKNAIKKYTYPHKINITVAKENSMDYYGSLQEIISVSDYKNSTDYIIRNFGKKSIPNVNEPFIAASLDGYKLFLMLDNGKIMDKYTLIHELRHLFDHLCNPKISSMPRRNIMANATDEQCEAFKEINDMFLNFNKYPDFSKCKNEISKKLKIIPNYEKINILQVIRNSVKTEINAYSQELKERCKSPFTQFLNILNISLILKTNVKYSKKIEFLNKLLKNFIKTERSNNK